MRSVPFLLFLFAFAAAGFADDAAKPKFAMTGELDLGVTSDSVANSTTDNPTELKLSPTLADGNVGFQSRLLLYPPTVSPSVTQYPQSNSLMQLDYAYGTYLLYGSLFDHFVTAKVSMGDFADTTDYVLSYNSNGFANLTKGNAIGGYIEGLTGAEVAFSPLKTLTVAAFVPWDNTGAGTPPANTEGRADVNVSYTYPKVIKVNTGYGNSYNGDVGGSLVQPAAGTNLFYANASLTSVENLALGAEFGNYYNITSSKSVENYATATVSYTIPNEKSGDSLTFSDDVFFFAADSGTSVIQEFFSTAYTFAQAFSAGDLILDLDANYANNYPATDSSSPGTLTSSDRNFTINPWVKLSLGAKNHILALGYAYNYDLDAAKAGYAKLLLNGTIYF
jgi:hypothetical protein